MTQNQLKTKFKEFTTRCETALNACDPSEAWVDITIEWKKFVDDVGPQIGGTTTTAPPQ